MEVNIFIFRRDLRIYDNLALNALLKHTKNKNILPLFIFNPKQIYEKNNAYFSNNAVQFMIESLKSLEKGCHVNYYEGDDIEVLNSISKKYKIKNIAFNKDYTPFAISRDKTIEDWCQKQGINIITAEDYTLFPMGVIKNQSGLPYQVYTPFYKACMKKKKEIPKPAKIPFTKINVIKTVTNFDKDKYYKDNNLIAVRGGRENGLMRLKKKFLNYSKFRDYPAIDATTKLSAYMKFGCLSVREIFHTYTKNTSLARELIWREFYANILYHFPHVLQGHSFKQKYDKIKWTNNIEWFHKWCKGETGFAFIDAGMRQLNETGWMHNRVRMITAMFLTKDLLIDWRWGEKYFATKLVDYDPASNNGGWQWSSSTGTDAQPYFRIFNPDTQIKRYDKDFVYIKRWKPNYMNIPKIVDHSERAKIAIKEFKRVL